MNRPKRLVMPGLLVGALVVTGTVASFAATDPRSPVDLGGGVAAAAETSGVPVRVATFNVLTSHATKGRSWLKRAPDVARQIVRERPGVVMLQELTPGRADGKKGKTKGKMRQTESLLKVLPTVGGAKYRLVRTTPYVPAGTPMSTQGARILYDSSRYTLVSTCPDRTGKRAYSRSCSLILPVSSRDPQKMRRAAAYAQFHDRRTGLRFWAVSVHLDARHSRNKSTEHGFEAIRASQARYVARSMAKLNREKLPVVFGGDINTWQNRGLGRSAHDAVRAAGYTDTVNAQRTVRANVATINELQRRVQPGTGSKGRRIDVIMAQGMTHADRWENVVKFVDSRRPSDHNMVVADIRLRRR